MKISLVEFSYRFAKEVLNSKLAIEEEIESILKSPDIDIHSLGRRNFNKILREKFVSKNWQEQI